MGSHVSAGYLLDTNQIGLAVTPQSAVWRRIGDARLRGVKVGTCIPVLCEIEAGVQHVARPDLYRANLHRLFRLVKVWPIDLETARRYGELSADLRRRGRALSQVDMMVAALALQVDATVVSTDRDFTAVPNLRLDDWSR
jgi:tRNA(fMet)-specific endonuclease VapC